MKIDSGRKYLAQYTLPLLGGGVEWSCTLCVTLGFKCSSSFETLPKKNVPAISVKQKLACKTLIKTFYIPFRGGFFPHFLLCAKRRWDGEIER